MRTLAIIPARYASTRFPGKPLALIEGKPMIEWVWKGVASVEAINEAVVATDDERIFQAVKAFGGQAMITSSNHKSGTDRCGEVLSRWGKEVDVVVNVQGDEPRVEHSQLESLIGSFSNPQVEIATLKKRIASVEELLSPNVVKVVTDAQGHALYFSRHAIPYQRGVEPEEWLNGQAYYKHVGIYAFRSEVLQRVVRMPQSPLEKSESLEQLRWMENGLRIAVRETEVENIGIDTPEDLLRLTSK